MSKRRSEALRIEAEHTPGVAALAAALVALRLRSGLSQSRLSRHSGVSVSTIRDLEQRRYRTRASTLRRLATTLAAARPKLGTAQELGDQLVAAASLSLCPESEYPAAIESRRDRDSQPLQRRRSRGAERVRVAIEDEDAAALAAILEAQDARAGERDERVARVRAELDAATAANVATLAEGDDERAAEVEQLLRELGGGAAGE